MRGRSSYVDGGGLLGISWTNIILFGFALFFFTKLRDAVSNLFTWGSPKNDPATEKAANQASNVVVNQKNLDKPLTYYTTFANILYTAMDGAGTDKAKLEQLLNHSPEEFKQIYKEFGIRKNTMFYLEAMRGNLVEWLEYELNDLGDNTLLTKLRQRYSITGLW